MFHVSPTLHVVYGKSSLSVLMFVVDTNLWIVEIKDCSVVYSVVYFDCIAVFQALYH